MIQFKSLLMAQTWSFLELVTFIRSYEDLNVGESDISKSIMRKGALVTLVICKSKLASGAWVSTWRGSSLADVTSPSCFWNVASASDWSMDVRVTDVRSSYRLWNVTSAGWSAAEWGNDVMYLRGVVSWAASHSALGVGVADVTYSHVTVHVHLHILKYKFI